VRRYRRHCLLTARNGVGGAAGRGNEKIGVNPQQHRTEIEILASGKRGKARQIWPLETRHTQLFTKSDNQQSYLSGAPLIVC
jgi:hypothetical protein